MAHPSAADHIAAAKRRLAHLAGLRARTDEADRRIRAAAEERHAAVLADIGRLRGRAGFDPAAADAYQRLTIERGQLEQVIAQSPAQSQHMA